MKTKVVFFLAILTLCSFFYSQTEPNWTTLEFKNYQIEHPSDARIIKNSFKSTFSIYFNVKDKVTMEINDLSGYMLTLDSYTQQFFDTFFRSSTVRVLEKKRLNLNNQPCYRIIAVVDDGHGEITFKTMVYIWVKNNWAYNLKYVAAPTKYEDYLPIAHKIASSFKYTK